MAFISQHASYTAAAPTTADRADCAVRAVSVAANIDYLRAFALFEGCGRRPNKETRWEWIETVLDVVRPERARCLDVRLTYRHETRTLDEWVRRNPRGRWVVCVTGHTIAVVDGVVHDWSSRLPGGRRKVCAWFAVD